MKQKAQEAKQRIGGTIEDRLNQIENFISNRGVGSNQLAKAKRVQRDVNLAIAAGCIITVAGIAFWALSSLGCEDNES